MLRLPATAATDTSRRRVLAICCTSLFLAQLDATAVNVALPAMGRDLGAGISDLQWVVDAYVLGLASLVMASGAAGDRLGRRRVFSIGLALFTACSAACSIAPALGWLIAARALQAVGASMLMPVTLSILANTFPDPAERARAIGVWASASGLSAAAGPILGGLATDWIGWRAIFWINVPIALVALAATRRYVAESRAPDPPRADWPGQLLMVLFAGLATYGLIEAPDTGWTSAQTLLVGGGAIVALGAFVAVELRAAEPLLDVRLFRRRAMVGATACGTLAYLALMGFLFLNSLYLQQVRGYSPISAGFAVLPCPLALLLVAPRAGRLTARVGPRLPVVLSGLAIAAGALLLLFVTPTVSLALLLPAYVLMGAGWGLLNAPVINTAVNVMPRAQAGLASAITGTARQLGAVLGVALLGSLTAARFQHLAALPGRARIPAPSGPADGALSAAFTTATHLSFAVALAVGLGVAGLAGLLLPSRNLES